MAFTLPPLPYDYDALEPTIDAQTMTLHHGKHHQAYVDKLNEGVAEEGLERQSLEEILANIKGRSKKVRNNGGGHWNHSFFWETMAPGGSGPNGQILEQINNTFGSFDDFKKKFAEAGVGQFGSGWVWLLAGGIRGLAIVSTPNQDNPLMNDVGDVQGYPILGNDVWEHAYYLKYKNRRPDYLNAWWDVVNWDKVNERLAKAPV
ncbi:MAG TPA: superoxide dismutase [Allosphingosinicella sp.]|jgi:Fe-Mn family superoxide dismutase